ncbi:MAG: hypothetical protein HPY55_00925 [Firmicutes bacterium]|nr:hypothetical protein [Bacillota bacterium]
MADGDGTLIGSLSKLMETPAGQGMDSTSFLCMLGLLNVQTIMTVVQKATEEQTVVSEAVKKSGPDAQSLAQALSGLLAGQAGQGGQGGQKINPATLLSLVNVLASQMEKGGAPKQEQKAEEPALPARLEHRGEVRRGQGDPGADQRDAKAASQK